MIETTDLFYAAQGVVLRSTGCCFPCIEAAQLGYCIRLDIQREPRIVLDEPTFGLVRDGVRVTTPCRRDVGVHYCSEIRFSRMENLVSHTLSRTRSYLQAYAP